MKHLIVSTLALVALAGPAAASTSFLGSTVTAEIDYPTLGTPFGGSSKVTATVTPVAVIPADSLDAGRPWVFDINADTISFTPNEGGFSYGGAPATFNGWLFTFAGLTDHITGVTVDPSTTFEPVSVGWTNDQVFLNYLGATPVDGESALFDVSFGAGTPEPKVWAMLLIGLSGLGAVLRGARRRRLDAISPA